MPAPKGNQFWKARASHGRDKIFKDPQILLEACEEYFQWCEDNPLEEHKAFSYQGAIIKTSLPKLRAMTIGGLCLFLGVDQTTWREYGRQEDFSSIVTLVDEAIRNQKFVGASADLLNANIIARDLGLSDKQELTGQDGGPVQVEDVSNLELARRIAYALKKAEKDA